MFACFAICMSRYNCQYFAIGWVCSSNDRVPCGHSLFPFLLQSSSGSHKRRNAHALKQARTLAHHSCRFRRFLYFSLFLKAWGEGGVSSNLIGSWLFRLEDCERREKRKLDFSYLELNVFCIRCFEF